MVEMSVDSLKANLTNPARAYLWEVIIPTIPAGGDADSIMLRAQSATKPGKSVGAIHVPFKQSGGLQFHGKLTYTHTWECTFIEGEDKKIFTAINGWLQKIVHDYNNVGDGDLAIKSDIYLNLLTTAGEVYQSIKLIGCFPQEVGEVPLSYDEEATIMYPVTFAYDRWEDRTA